MLVIFWGHQMMLMKVNVKGAYSRKAKGLSHLSRLDVSCNSPTVCLGLISSFHSVSKYFLWTYHMADVGLGSGETTVRKRHPIPATMILTVQFDINTYNSAVISKRLLPKGASIFHSFFHQRQEFISQQLISSTESLITITTDDSNRHYYFCRNGLILYMLFCHLFLIIHKDIFIVSLRQQSSGKKRERERD